jgi:hypothetical protein
MPIGQGLTDDTEQDLLGDLDADDLRRTSGLIRHVRPVTQPDPLTPRSGLHGCRA